MPGAGVTVLSEVANAPHDDFRGGRLNVWNEVRRSRLQPIDQGHPTTVPAGTSPATSCAGDCTNSRKSGRLWLAPFECRSVDPDAMEDDRDLTGDRDLRFLHADAFDQPYAPCLES